MDRKNILIALSLVAVASIPVVVALAEHRVYSGFRNIWIGLGTHGSIAVSIEFQNHVINIASNDVDVQTLLNDGYNVTGVSSIINYIVNANGDVTMKAANAIVVLHKGTRDSVFVWVNVEGEKVTRIVTSRTIIR